MFSFLFRLKKTISRVSPADEEISRLWSVFPGPTTLLLLACKTAFGESTEPVNLNVTKGLKTHEKISNLSTAPGKQLFRLSLKANRKENR